jgi:hypothetical protein
MCWDNGVSLDQEFELKTHGMSRAMSCCMPSQNAHGI